MIRPLAVALALGLFIAPAQAQSPVETFPYPAGTNHVDGTVAVSNTFQTVVPTALSVPKNKSRKGCLIQNNGSNTMWIFIGPAASGTKGASFTLIPPTAGVQGGSFSCATGAGGVVQDEISLTGTSTEAFTASWQ